MRTNKAPAYDSGNQTPLRSFVLMIVSLLHHLVLVLAHVIPSIVPPSLP